MKIRGYRTFEKCFYFMLNLTYIQQFSVEPILFALSQINLITPRMIKFENLSIKFKNIQITYPDWEISLGNQALILGNSGSGKTSLLHLLTGLMKPSSGKIYLKDKELSIMNDREINRLRGREMGVIFQKSHLIKSLNVSDNIKLAGQFSGKKINIKKIQEVTKLLGLEHLLKRKIYQLSEGQKQRVTIARAVVHEPSILAADEPTASLDDENATAVVQLLKSQASRCNATLLIATHDHRVKDQFKNRLEL